MIFIDDEGTARDSDSPMTAITDQTAGSTFTTTTDKTMKERLAHEMGLQVCTVRPVRGGERLRGNTLRTDEMIHG